MCFYDGLHLTVAVSACEGEFTAHMCWYVEATSWRGISAARVRARDGSFILGVLALAVPRVSLCCGGAVRFACTLGCRDCLCPCGMWEWECVCVCALICVSVAAGEDPEPVSWCVVVLEGSVIMCVCARDYVCPCVLECGHVDL